VCYVCLFVCVCVCLCVCCVRGHIVQKLQLVYTDLYGGMRIRCDECDECDRDRDRDRDRGRDRDRRSARSLDSGDVRLEVMDFASRFGEQRLQHFADAHDAEHARFDRSSIHRIDAFARDDGNVS